MHYSYGKYTKAIMFYFQYAFFWPIKKQLFDLKFIAIGLAVEASRIGLAGKRDQTCTATGDFSTTILAAFAMVNWQAPDPIQCCGNTKEPKCKHVHKHLWAPIGEGY